MNLMLPILLAAAGVASNGTTRITSAKVNYDRKEGLAYFSGGVTVEDPTYVLHADRAFVYTGETNDLKKIVALGNIAITNESRRAYGAKATYFRNSGAVILSSGTNVVAEVRDVGPDGDQVLRGKKIKFWTGSRQVEVLEAEITAPAKGAMDGMRGLFGR